MLTFSQVSKSFEGRQVLRDVTLSVAPHSRTAVVGVNGSGKSTLLRLAAGLIAPDVGSVRTPPGTTIAYVPQDYLPVGDQTVETYLKQRAGVLELEQRLRRLERVLVDGAPDAADSYVEATDRYTALGGYELPGRIERTLAVLELPSSLLGRPVVELSSAGINRHGEGDERALHRRSSDPRWPRVMRRRL